MKTDIKNTRYLYSNAIYAVHLLRSVTVDGAPSKIRVDITRFTDPEDDNFGADSVIIIAYQLRAKGSNVNGEVVKEYKGKVLVKTGEIGFKLTTALNVTMYINKLISSILTQEFNHQCAYCIR